MLKSSKTLNMAGEEPERAGMAVILQNTGQSIILPGIGELTRSDEGLILYSNSKTQREKDRCMAQIKERFDAKAENFLQQFSVDFAHKFPADREVLAERFRQYTTPLIKYFWQEEKKICELWQEVDTERDQKESMDKELQSVKVIAAKLENDTANFALKMDNLQEKYVQDMAKAEYEHAAVKKELTEKVKFFRKTGAEVASQLNTAKYEFHVLNDVHTELKTKMQLAECKLQEYSEHNKQLDAELKAAYAKLEELNTNKTCLSTFVDQLKAANKETMMNTFLAKIEKIEILCEDISSDWQTLHARYQTKLLQQYDEGFQNGQNCQPVVIQRKYDAGFQDGYTRGYSDSNQDKAQILEAFAFQLRQHPIVP